MFCAHCGKPTQPDAHFCGYCGAAIMAPDVTSSKRMTEPLSMDAEVALASHISDAATLPPRKEQLHALKLELKRLKLQLREVNAQMSQLRAQHSQTSAFVPGRALRHAYKEVEDARLMGPQSQKQALQQQIFRIEEQILALESQANGS